MAERHSARMSKITNDGLTLVWHRMLNYSCTHMATVGFKGLMLLNMMHALKVISSCMLVCSAGDHAARVSEYQQGMHQQQHGSVCPPEHDADRRESFRRRFFQTHLSRIHSTVSNHRSRPGLLS